MSLPDPPKDFCDLIIRQGRFRSSTLALAFLQDADILSQTMTYGELEGQTRSLAGFLQGFAKPGDRALLSYPNGLDFVRAFLACLRSGIIAVPVPPLEHSRGGAAALRLLSVAADAQAAVVLGNKDTIQAAHSGGLPAAHTMHWLRTDDAEPKDAGSFREFRPAATDTAYLQYTSGSTSIPRGVKVTHENIMHHCDAVVRAGAGDPESKTLNWLPCFHDYGLVHGILVPLYAGATGYLMTPLTFLRRPLRWLQAISRFRITHSGAFNFAYDLCSRAASPQATSQLELSCWRIASCGAEPVHRETVERFIKTFTPCGFKPEAFAPAYGLAEATLLVSLKRETGPSWLDLDAECLERSVVQEKDIRTQRVRSVISCGYPVGDTNVVIADPQNCERAAPNSVGEIWLSGRGVARGYWNNTEQTQSVFSAYLKGGEGPFLRTGDLGFLSGGQLFVTGRIKDLIIIQGNNHYPQDIETTVEGCKPSLKQGSCVAFAVEGTTEENLVVVLEVGRKDGTPDHLELALAVRQAVGDAHELPVHTVVIVKPGGIPKTTSGKIQRQVCKAEFVSGKLDEFVLARLNPEQPSLNNVPMAPRGPIEEILLEIWRDVLSVSPRGIHDNFFELGGNSLLATQIASRVRDVLRIDLPLRSVFENPTIAKLSELIAATEKQTSSLATYEIPASRRRIAPLSFSQQRMWFMDRLTPGSLAYSLPLSVRLAGMLDTSALSCAAADLVQRHESLRTVFKIRSEGLVQIVSDDASAPIVEKDLAQFPANERGDQLLHLVLQECQKPFDLTLGPLIRFLLVRLDEQDWVFVVNMHHIVSDQWSYGVLCRELARSYNSYRAGKSPDRQASKIQYADFAHWQRAALTDEALKGSMQYWRDRLDGLAVLSLPTDHTRPPRQTFRGSYSSVSIPDSLLDDLHALSSQNGATLFMTCFACFAILLSRYTGQEDIAVGVPVANRRQKDVEDLIGTFVNILVMRIDLSGDPRFVDLLALVRERSLEAFANQDVPFERLVDELDRARDISRSPLVQVLFNVLNAPIGDIQLDGLTWSTFEFDRGSAQFDLTLTVDPQVSRKVSLDFNTDLFEGSTAERMLSHFRNLLQAVVRNPRKNLSRLTVLAEAEWNEIVFGWNQTELLYPQQLTVATLFENQVVRSSVKCAVRMGGDELSYDALNRRANRVAHYLRRQGVTPGTLVGICMDRSTTGMVGLLAILKAGGAYLPLDPAYPQERLLFMIDDSGAPLVVTTSEHLARLPGRGRSVICLDRLESDLAKEPDWNPDTAPQPDDLAYVIYTSGSTGRPKGVEIRQSSLVNFLHAIQSEVQCSSSDTLLAVTTLSFDIAGLELHWPLVNGGTVELVSSDIAADGRRLREVLERIGPTIMQATPTTWRMLINAGWRGSPRLVALCGGEPLPKSLANDLLRRTRTLWNLYGPTETTIWSTMTKVELNDATITIGRPIGNTEIYILDGHLNPVPTGVPGEIYIGGAGVARGYRNRPELTEERFIGHPFDHHRSRVYRTGDLARYLPDGRIEHLGRLDHQVKIRGFRIELGEVEAGLQTHPEIRQALVTAGQGLGADGLVAYILPKNGVVAGPEELRRFLRNMLPDFMVPNAFVWLNEFPLTPNGKIDVAALPRSKDQSRPKENTRIGPRTTLEAQLVALFEQVLGVYDIGIRDSFFDLGGHSLAAVQLFARLDQIYGCQLPLATLFQAPTVEELAKLFTQSGWTTPWRSLVAINPQGSLPPIFAIPGVEGYVLGFGRLATLLGNDHPFYALQPLGLSKHEQPFTNVERMAEHYIAEIRSVQPKGPYLICGACTGGVVAYEVAQQLIGTGESVGLAMLESWHPSSYRAYRFRPPMFLWPSLFLFARAMSGIRKSARSPLKEWLALYRKKLKALRQSIFEVPEKGAFDPARVTEATYLAVSRYRPKPFHGSLLNVISSERPTSAETQDTRRVWESLALKGCHTVQVPATDSGRLLVSPYVELVTRELHEYAIQALSLPKLPREQHHSS